MKTYWNFRYDTNTREILPLTLMSISAIYYTGKGELGEGNVISK